MSQDLPISYLKSFVAIAQTGSLVKASETECVTEAALSLRMKRLSERLGKELFVKERGRLVIAPAGLILMDYAKRILELNEKAFSVIGSPVERQKIRLGVMPVFSNLIMPNILKRFADLYPHMELTVREGRAEGLSKRLYDGEFDLIVGLGEPGDPATICRSNLIWVGDEALAAEAVLPLALPAGPSPVRQTALSMLQRAGRQYRVAFESPSFAALLAASWAGLGLTWRTSMFEAAPQVASPMLPLLPEVSCIVALAPESSTPVRKLCDLIKGSVHAATKFRTTL